MERVGWSYRVGWRDGKGRVKGKEQGGIGKGEGMERGKAGGREGIDLSLIHI